MGFKLVVIIAFITSRVSQGERMDSITYMEETLMNAMKTNENSTEMNSLVSVMTAAYVDNTDTSRTLPTLPEKFDCYGYSWAMSRLFRRLFKRDSFETVNTCIFFINSKDPDECAKMKWDEEFSLEGSEFDPTRRTFIIVHGFLSNASMNWILEMRDALLRQSECNVFAVDWSGGGNSWRYWKAVANTRVAGHALTRFIYKLIDAGLSKDNLHLIGHSLGAHICGFASRLLGGVSRITGLDPAEPCFRIDDPRMKLDKSDAAFVDIIHTNAQLWSRFALGLPSNIGHVDFYPNGGMHQPGCAEPPKSWIKKVWHYVIKDINRAICSHGRAYMLFTESVKSLRCVFWGHRWDGSQDTITTTVKTPCNSTTCIPMGIDTDEYQARGMFLTRTGSYPPYCIRDPRADELMDDENLLTV